LTCATLRRQNFSAEELMMNCPKALTIKRVAGLFLAFALVGACVSEGDSGNASCSTTVDGVYPCKFQMTDENGSFEITAAGKPTFILEVEEPGVAYGFVNVSDRNVSLPGKYLRSQSDPACWRNTETETEICAR
jgi:hypothetical protein